MRKVRLFEDVPKGIAVFLVAVSFMMFLLFPFADSLSEGSETPVVNTQCVEGYLFLVTVEGAKQVINENGHGATCSQNQYE